MVRSLSFFPADPLDGEVIYEGVGESFPDFDVILDTASFILSLKNLNIVILILWRLFISLIIQRDIFIKYNIGHN